MTTEECWSPLTCPPPDLPLTGIYLANLVLFALSISTCDTDRARPVAQTSVLP